MALKRRSFLKRTALAAAGLTIIPRHVLGGNGFIAPSDKITLGVVGLGRMGLGLGRRFGALEMARIVAACDVDNTKTERFKQEIGKIYAEQAEGKSSGEDIQTYRDFRELISRDDIDGVMVATPDHWHAIITIMAMKAGKDIYCEKPMAHTIKEGRMMVKAARKHERVFQTGSMQRSWRDFRHACELVRNGYIGDIEKVVVSIGTPAVSVPCNLDYMDTPENLDWNTWLGPAQERAYHSDLAPTIPETFWGKWRYYEEFGGGMLSDWGAHMFDIAQWALGMDDTGPVEFIPPVNPLSQEGLIMKYANGVTMVQESFGRGNAVQFVGTEGTINISRQFLDSDPPSLAKKEMGDNDTRLYHSDNHYQDWLDCIKSRKKPICDVEIGHRTATVCNIANMAYKLKRNLRWDPEKEKFIKDPEANLMRTKQYRSEWKLPKA